ELARSQRQGAGFLEHRCTAWIATTNPDPAQDQQGWDFGRGRESIVVEYAGRLLGSIIPAPLLQAGTGLPGPHICAPGIEIMLGTIGKTLLQEALGQGVVTVTHGATGQIGVRTSDMFLPSPLQGKL